MRADPEPGYDSRGVWGIDRRPFDALTRHGQDATTGRSAHTTQVHVAGLVLLYNMETRGYPTRSLRRLDTCPYGLIPGDCAVFWDIRVQQEISHRPRTPASSSLSLSR